MSLAAGASQSGADRLQQIMDARRADVARLRREHPLAPGPLPALRGFRAALARPGLQVIAEIKRRSPSAGAIRTDADPPTVARSYQAGGAAALSVLTEERFFGGALGDLETARAACGLPVLRKDFTVDAYQLGEARAAGADAVLLIVAGLGAELDPLYREARSLGLDVLVEVHDERELDRAVALGADLIGVNNRNLADFTIDLGTFERLRPRFPTGVVAVAESGIETADDMRRMAAAGADACLIGSSLMRSADPAAKLRELLEAAAG